MYIASLPLNQEGNYVGDGELQLSRHPRKHTVQSSHTQTGKHNSFAQDKFVFVEFFCFVLFVFVNFFFSVKFSCKKNYFFLFSFFNT